MSRVLGKFIYILLFCVEIHENGVNWHTFTPFYPFLSYDEHAVKNAFELKKDTGIYISTGYSAHDCISIIRELLKRCDLNPEVDFVYTTRAYKNVKTAAAQNGQGGKGG